MAPTNSKPFQSSQKISYCLSTITRYPFLTISNLHSVSSVFLWNRPRTAISTFRGRACLTAVYFPTDFLHKPDDFNLYDNNDLLIEKNRVKVQLRVRKEYIWVMKLVCQIHVSLLSNHLFCAKQGQLIFYK